MCSQSYQIIVYLNDGWTCESFRRCARLAKSVLRYLLNVGVCPHIYFLVWLGFSWNWMKV